MVLTSGRQTGTASAMVAAACTIAAGIGMLWVFRGQSTASKDDYDDDDDDEMNKKRSPVTLDSNFPVTEINTTTASSTNGTKEEQQQQEKQRILTPGRITIAHGSVTGTCAKLAQQVQDVLKDSVEDRRQHIQLGAIDEWDWWDELLNPDDDEDDGLNKALKSKNQRKHNDNNTPPPPVVILLLPTHHRGSWPPTASCLQQALQDLENDWRIENKPLKKSKVHVAVMGMGCSDYGDDTMGVPAKEAFHLFRKLGATMIGKKVRIGDDSITDSADRVVQAWIHHDIVPSIGFSDDDNDHGKDDYMQEKEPQIMDMEDMGNSMAKSSKDDNRDDNDDDDNDDPSGNSSNEPREMVTAAQAKSLKKEGYRLIGTHSAVKLCRWTKHQLRGRGGCYKHTFYGITSYQCMEATPSLACANKCVFCWRHHKNPVGKEWKWKTDDPHFIVESAVEQHVQMIKETKGIPGVRMDRWKEAHKVRHCALSLVGEPIMYPRIDELLHDLHERSISSFLVTNGQHPEAIASLRPVTQLYVSVDAPTPESLVAIDRPLFSDAWERLQRSLLLLRDKGQRTVARLTVVKGWNSDEVEGYAKLIALGKVSLIEIKGVTYCGKSDASNLNMSNTPWHHEVVELAKTLLAELRRMRQLGGSDPPPEYDFACEHKHSVSVLLARVDQFTDEGPTDHDSKSPEQTFLAKRKWRTWIDYDKFHELAAKNAKDPSFTFSVRDYTAETPAWALFGSEEEGFDPTDTRHRRKNRYPKYTKFDDQGVPTHDHNEHELSSEERSRLAAMMEQRMQEIGGSSGTTTTELKGGEKLIQDAKLMFRGMTVVVP